MSQPYIGQVALFSFKFPPRGYAFCNGQQLSVSQNQPLFSLLGNKFGGDGVNTFNLPNLQTRAVVGGAVSGTSVQNMGANGGETTHTLTINETPSHAHGLQSDSATQPGANVTSPQNNSLGQSQGTVPSPFNFFLYTRANPSSKLAPQAIGSTGGQPHENMMPSLGLSYCIALTGIYPPRS